MFELHRYKKHYLEYEPFSKQIIDVTLVQLLSKPDVLLQALNSRFTIILLFYLVPILKVPFYANR